MARLNIFGAKGKYIALFIGVSICILLWLNMNRSEGFQNVPVGEARPVPMDEISAQKKQDFASAIIQLYHNIIISPPAIPSITNLPGSIAPTAPMTVPMAPPMVSPEAPPMVAPEAPPPAPMSQ